MTEEIWKPIPGYEGCYEVSNLGRVKSVERRSPRVTPQGKAGFRFIPEKFLKGGVDNIGRWHVGLRRAGETQPRRIHSLVLLAFIGPRPEGQVGMHLNGDPSDNRLENLEYGTQSRNLIDALWHGRRKLTEADILMIRSKVESGLARGDITNWAKQFGVSKTHIHRITTGKAYGHIV